MPEPCARWTSSFPGNGWKASSHAAPEVRADRVIDASGRYVLPGIIDAHNHPVYADRIDRLSRAALSGGVTTVIPYIGAVAAWGKQGRVGSGHRRLHQGRETGSCIDFGCTAP